MIPEATHSSHENYLKASRHIYNALEYSCCPGTAITLIEKHKKEREGVKAWKNLISWMESQGNEDYNLERA